MKTVVVLDPVGTGNFQGVFPGEDDDWIVARDTGDAMQFDRHDETGRCHETRVLPGAGHVTSSGLVGGKLLTSFQGDLVACDWGTKELGKPEPIECWTAKEVQASLSPTRRYVLLRKRNHASSTFERRRVDDLLAGRNTVLDGPLTLPRAHLTEQSFGVIDDQVIVGYGESNRPNWLEQWPLSEPKRVARVDVSKLGQGLVDNPWYEIECAPGRWVCMKLGTGSRRRLLVALHGLAE
jgi:hypothetical protein